MFLKSIRWRLQLWYGVILVAVLVGFGVMAYQLESGRQFRRIDEELRRGAGHAASVLRPPPPRGRGSGERSLNGIPPEDQRGPWRNPDRRFDEGPPPRWSTEPQFQTQLAETFAGDPGGLYYVLWHRDGEEIGRSTNAPVSVPRPTRGTIGEPVPPRTRGSVRELTVNLRPGVIILVGRSIAPELAELRNIGWLLAGVGGIVLVLGLAGGGLMVNRALQPIRQISSTAARISSGDLSQRISVDDAQTELGQLAAVLNSTFARLDAAFTQQRQFTSDAAHELRTPVSVILTQSQMALNRERSATQYKETVETCQRTAQRMRRLIESLLDLARFDAGQAGLKRMPFDLATVAADCIEFIRPLASDRKISIRADLRPVICLGDFERVAQVITNLLSNAVNYNHEGGEIRVSVVRESDLAVLEVVDTGIGIEPDHLTRVFDRFYRADAARTSAEGRTGLGLAIARAIVHAHGGTIEAVSEQGRGSIFRVHLPAGE